MMLQTRITLPRYNKKFWCETGGRSSLDVEVRGVENDKKYRLSANSLPLLQVYTFLGV